MRKRSVRELEKLERERVALYEREWEVPSPPLGVDGEPSGWLNRLFEERRFGDLAEEGRDTAPFPLWITSGVNLHDSFFCLEFGFSLFKIFEKWDGSWKPEIASRFSASLRLTRKRVRELERGALPSEGELREWDRLRRSADNSSRRVFVHPLVNENSGLHSYVVSLEMANIDFGKEKFYLSAGPFKSIRGVGEFLLPLLSDWERWELRAWEGEEGVTDAFAEIRKVLDPGREHVFGSQDSFTEDAESSPLSSQHLVKATMAPEKVETSWEILKPSVADEASWVTSNEKVGEWTVDEWVASATDSPPFPLWREFWDIRSGPRFEPFSDDLWFTFCDLVSEEWRPEFAARFPKRLKLTEARKAKLLLGAKPTPREQRAWEQVFEELIEWPRIVRVYRLLSSNGDEAFVLGYEHGWGLTTDYVLEAGPLKSPEGIAALMAPHMESWIEWGYRVDSKDPRAVEFGERIVTGLDRSRYVENAI